MKLRIYGNSIRLRLGQNEVEQLALGKPISQHTNLFPQSLVCKLVPNPEPSQPAATFNGGVLEISFDQRQITHWARGNSVEINGVIAHDGQEPVRLLVEKDFQCLHSTGENQPDSYPNPLSTTK